MKLKIKIVMLYDENRAKLGDIAASVAKAYAEKHGYGFVCYHHVLDSRINPSWNKVLAVKAQLDDCDWVMWTDADAIFIRDDILLEDVIAKFSWDKPLMISLDKYGVCFGIFLIKNCMWSHTFLGALPVLGPALPESPLDTHDTWEQNSIKCLMQYFPAFRSNVATIPEWMIANPNSDYWPEAWMCHFWAAGRSGTDEVEKVMARIASGDWSRGMHKS